MSSYKLFQDKFWTFINSVNLTQQISFLNEKKTPYGCQNKDENKKVEKGRTKKNVYKIK